MNGPSKVPPTTFVEAQDVLAASLPNYERREHQEKLATEIELALEDGLPLLAQAGTGTGKSLGYLIPAILSGKRVVVTTATKALQDQLANKDLPFLKEHLGVDFEFAVLKGRSSYACLAKILADDAAVPSLPQVLDFLRDDPLASAAAIASDADILDSDPTLTGERSEFPFQIADGDWFKLSSNSDECPGKKDCPFGNTCYAERAKTRAKAADVIVINHALFFMDRLVRQRTDGKVDLIGKYDVIIADEAHELETFATSAFGSRFTEWTLRSLMNEIGTFTRRHDQYAKVEGATADVNQANIRLWSSLPTPNKRENENGRLHLRDIVDNPDVWVNVITSLYDLRKALDHVVVDDTKAIGRLRVLCKRTDNLLANFEIIATSDDDQYVRWIEVEETKKGDTRKILNSAPVSVADHLRPLWAEYPAILTSATMPFKYTAERLGFDNYTDLDVGSPFDYPTQALLYVPQDLPDPTPANRLAWQAKAIERIEELVQASQGGALLLFTSNADLNAAYKALADRLPFTVLKQGGGEDNKVLARRFAEDDDSVLFATRSFFTGVDFQGTACRLVVISKLPFPVPNEPLTEARCEVLERSGKRSFSHYTIPEMTLPLQQGFGRLIRHRNDRGVVAILDPRLTSKGYGKGIVADLPPARLVTSFDEVRDFFGGDA